MDKVEIIRSVQKQIEIDANTYEAERGHGLATPEEERSWRLDIADAVKINPGAVCLDVGAGTGVLTRLLADWVGPSGHVVAADVSAAMLEQNRKLLPTQFSDRVSFLLGDADDDKLLSSAPYKSFDFITTRQVVCLLVDPISVFRKWHTWLNKDGRIIILDGLWMRRGWTDGWAELVDHFPLSCIQNLAAVPYMLKQAQFVIEECCFLKRVNEWFEKTKTVDFESPRYIVVAKK